MKQTAFGRNCTKTFYESMKYKAVVHIMPLKELLDPQGKTVAKNLPNIGLEGVESVRVGRRVELVLNAQNNADAHEKVDLACQKLLANLIMESYEYEVVQMA
jgi:phosphoribosylformylglycinamidine synthase PurS subunit